MAAFIVVRFPFLYQIRKKLTVSQLHSCDIPSYIRDNQCRFRESKSKFVKVEASTTSRTFVQLSTKEATSMKLLQIVWNFPDMVMRPFNMYYFYWPVHEAVL